MQRNNYSNIVSGLYRSKLLPSFVQSAAHFRYANSLISWIASMERPMNNKILDIGCGKGSILKQWVSQNTVYGMDISTKMLCEAQAQGFLPIVGSLDDKLPFDDCYFDKVCAFGVLPYAKKLQNTLHEAKRVLKPSGHLFISSAVRSGFRTITYPFFKLLGARNFVPTTQHLLNGLLQEGFTVKKISGIAWPVPIGLIEKGYLLRTLGTTLFILAEKSNDE